MYRCFCVPQVYTKATVNRYSARYCQKIGIALVTARYQEYQSYFRPQSRLRNISFMRECSHLIYPDLPLQTLCLLSCLAVHLFFTSPPALCLESRKRGKEKLFPNYILSLLFSLSLPNPACQPQRQE